VAYESHKQAAIRYQISVNLMPVSLS